MDVRAKTEEEFDLYIAEKEIGGQRSLSKAILNQPAPPCEKYKCDKYSLCAKEQLACKSFALYVSLPSGKSYDPKDEIPTHARYLKIFSYGVQQ